MATAGVKGAVLGMRLEVGRGCIMHGNEQLSLHPETTERESPSLDP